MPRSQQGELSSMATTAQFNANRENAQHSTGPRSIDGKAHTSQNALSFGLFSTKNCVQPHETAEYEDVCRALWSDLHPQGTLQELFATELVRAAWRLRRCAAVEASLAEQTTTDPMLQQDLLRIQTAVDRARAQAHGITRRCLQDLRRLQSEAEPPAPVFTKPTQSQPPPLVQIPRSAHCPCGSGEKYKRCCGKNAPPLLHHAA